MKRWETPTQDGPIPHRDIVVPGLGVVHAPVKLESRRWLDRQGREWQGVAGFGCGRLPLPMRRNGRLVFALPGGGEAVR